MTLPALWIRQNMLQSPGPIYNVNERPLTEAEMKVQRSLKKLSIPEWYLNNSSHPPKILMNDTPIDMRPPSWKEQNVKNSINSSTLSKQIKNHTVNRNGVLETEIGPGTAHNQFYGTFRINRRSIGNGSPVSKKRSSLDKCQAREKESPKSRLFNVSRTFPRVSPSRKIQNINIVFDQPDRSSCSHTITDLDASDPEVASEDSPNGERLVEPSLRSPPDSSRSLAVTDLDRTEAKICAIGDSLVTRPSETIDRRLESPPICSDTCGVTDLDDPRRPPEIDDSSSADRLTKSADETLDGSRDAIYGSKPTEEKIQRASNRELTYIRPWKPTARPEVRSCVTPEGKFTSAVSFKLRASSTPRGSPVSIFAPSGIELTPRVIHREPTSGLPVSPPKSEKSPTLRTSPRAPDVEEVCEACKADPSKARQSSNGRATSGFRPRILLPSIGERPSSAPRPASSSSSLVSLASAKKSSELEAMIKKTSAREGKSLVQEIIEELNEKCRSSTRSAYVSPGSKNFVRKLVRALEKGKTPILRDEDDDKSYGSFADFDDYEDYHEEDNSDYEAKSAAASTSISYKDTDSSAGSDSDLRSPTMKIDYSYDCNMNFRKDGSEPVKSAASTMVTSTPDLEKENDSVYWIPVARSKLPRTSSLLSMISRLSTTNPQQTPCVSPISRSNDRQSGWGTTYKSNERTRTLRRIDETTILDSGYSDRSRVQSSGSSDDTWFDDTESTWTASETGSLSNVSFSLGSRLRPSSIRIHGRPFVV